MATGSSGGSLGPDPDGATRHGGTDGGGRTGGRTDADADVRDFAAGLYGQTGRGGESGSASGAPTEKEGSMQKKRRAKKSIRTVLAENLEKTSIESGPAAGKGTNNGAGSSNGADTIDIDSDEVFSGNVPSDAQGSEGGAGDGTDFPSDYNVIRTAKAASLAPTRLGSLFGLGRTDTGTRLGYGSGGLAVEGDCRPFLAQNYHCAEKGQNLSFSVAKPSKDGRDDLLCLACPARHSHADRMARDGKPVVIVLADQSFPAVLPAAGGDCVIVVRVEDGMLSELDSAFSDRFRAFLRPHGSLTPGSVVLVGSLSHLRAGGLQDYAENFAKTYVSIGAKVGPGVDIVPLVYVPMHGLESGSLIRNMMDLDAWFLTVQGGGRTVLPKTRETFWVVSTGGVAETSRPTESQTLMMPVGLRNHRRHPVVSDPYEGPIPTSIPPASEEIEKRIIGAMFTELNDVYGLTLDVTPDTSRNPSPSIGNGQARMIFVGASHMARLSVVAAEANVEVALIGNPGWLATRDSLAEAARKLTELNPTDNDVVIIDLFSNNAYMGTDDCGLPCRAQKGRADGRYHVGGALQTAPRSVFEKIVSDAKDLINAANGCKTVMFAPIPRYVSGKCCSDLGHVTNWNTDSLTSEIHRAGEMAEQAISGSEAITRSTFINVLEFFDCTDPNLSEVRTGGGQSIWLASDPVHLSQQAYSELATMMAEMLHQGESEPRPRKRARLESVVPAIPGGRRGHQGRIRPPLWVSGMAARATSSGRGRGRGSRASRGRWGSY